MAISIDSALNEVECIKPILRYEIIPIEESINRIIAEDIKATYCLPKFNNSAMDGYAIIFENKKNILQITDTIFAGDNYNKEIKENSCVKIMTGAIIPTNATAVIPKEEITIIDNDFIKINSDIKLNQHIRFIGEDIKKDELIIKKGEEINFSKITLLSSQGISHIKVFKKPKVVVFSSGEELKLHYERIEEHQIYNSNTPTLIARAKELGCDVSFIGQAKDSILAIKELIENSLDADLIITSGGVSVGDADFTKEAFNQLDCKTIFDGINIKPGKPTVFGKISNTYILNLPGNPLASSLIFELLAKELIQKLKGANRCFLGFIETTIDKEYINKKGKTTIIPGFFDGSKFTISNKRSPGMVSILSTCNSFIVIDKNLEKINTNRKIKILPINWDFYIDEKKDFIIYE